MWCKHRVLTYPVLRLLRLFFTMPQFIRKGWLVGTDWAHDAPAEDTIVETKQFKRVKLADIIQRWPSDHLDDQIAYPLQSPLDKDAVKTKEGYMARAWVFVTELREAIEKRIEWVENNKVQAIYTMLGRFTIQAYHFKWSKVGDSNPSTWKNALKVVLPDGRSTPLFKLLVLDKRQVSPILVVEGVKYVCQPRLSRRHHQSRRRRRRYGWAECTVCVA